MSEGAQLDTRDTVATQPSARNIRSILLGAAFLMATSAIGPGFLTQTAVFTAQLGASFGFAILVSVLFDLGAQLNIWRVIAVARKDRKSTRLNSSHCALSRMPSSA